MWTVWLLDEALPVVLIIIKVFIKRKILSVETVPYARTHAHTCTYMHTHMHTHTHTHAHTHTQTHTHTHTHTLCTGTLMHRHKYSNVTRISNVMTECEASLGYKGSKHESLGEGLLPLGGEKRREKRSGLHWVKNCRQLLYVINYVEDTWI